MGRGSLLLLLNASDVRHVDVLYLINSMNTLAAAGHGYAAFDSYCSHSLLQTPTEQPTLAIAQLISAAAFCLGSAMTTLKCGRLPARTSPTRAASSSTLRLHSSSR